MRVNMDSSISWDPRFKMLAKRLGLSRNDAVGGCFFLWLHCYQSRTERVSLEEADIATGTEGFAKALAGAGLADFDGPDFIIVHGVAERIRFLLKQAERGSKGGQASAQANATANAERNPSERSSGENHTAQAYTPSPSLTPSQKTEDSSEPSQTPASEQKVIFSFECLGTGPKEWHLTETKLAEWQECYPGIDVLVEIRKARQWLIDNPAKRKTAKGMPRFLNGWIERSQNSGKTQSANRNPPVSARVRNDAPKLEPIPEEERKKVAAMIHKHVAGTGEKP